MVSSGYKMITKSMFLFCGRNFEIVGTERLEVKHSKRLELETLKDRGCKNL